MPEAEDKFCCDLLKALSVELRHFIENLRQEGSLPVKYRNYDTIAEHRGIKNFSLQFGDVTKYSVQLHARENDPYQTHIRFLHQAHISVACKFKSNVGTTNKIITTNCLEELHIDFFLQSALDNPCNVSLNFAINNELVGIEFLSEIMLPFQNDLYDKLKKVPSFQALDLNFEDRMAVAGIDDLVNLAYAINRARCEVGRVEPPILVPFTLRENSRLSMIAVANSRD